ncbi:MAG: CsbD family protein [Streptosporangiaceae bacterium]
MGFMDKLRNRFRMSKGHAKQGIGRTTNDRSLQAEGQRERVDGSARQVGEQVKDAGKNVKDAFKK